MNLPWITKARQRTLDHFVANPSTEFTFTQLSTHLRMRPWLLNRVLKQLTAQYVLTVRIQPGKYPNLVSYEPLLPCLHAPGGYPVISIVDLRQRPATSDADFARDAQGYRETRVPKVAGKAAGVTFVCSAEEQVERAEGAP